MKFNWGKPYIILKQNVYVEDMPKIIVIHEPDCRVLNETQEYVAFDFRPGTFSRDNNGRAILNTKAWIMCEATPLLLELM